MVQVYSPKDSARLRYTCNVIFRDFFSLKYSLLSHISEVDDDKPLVIYSDGILPNGIAIPNEGLLFENGIVAREILWFDNGAFAEIFIEKRCKIDLFSAIFYLLSRYEEYLPHTKDEYGRYGHRNSILFKKGLLKIPIVNVWLCAFAKKLNEIFPALEIKLPTYTWLPTYDIDMFFAYKHKGLLRNVGGLLKKNLIAKLKVLAGKEKDPFDVTKALVSLHNNLSLPGNIFFLMAQKLSVYDRNNPVSHHCVKQAIQDFQHSLRPGLHPSWSSFFDPDLINSEKKILEQITGITITDSRQHYIKMELPHTYRHLIKIGITKDFSMGYGSVNGFRAGFANPYQWFDIKMNQSTDLTIVPFSFMDANAFYEQKQMVEESFEELNNYAAICKKYHGSLCTIFHNSFLGSAKEFNGWWEAYSSFAKQTFQSADA